jgi:two-component system phosphate regulon sensor histidine kinase PhoR
MIWEPVLVLVAAACGVAWRRAEGVRQATTARWRGTEAELTESRAHAARLAAGLAGASDALIVLDQHLQIVASNPAAQEMAGRDTPALDGARLTDVELLGRLEHAVKESCERQATNYLEIEHVEPPHPARLLAVRIHPLGALGAVVGIDDQSRIKQLESLRRDFVANVSHELKTPLTAIKGFVETLQDDPEMPPETQARFHDKIARQTERLATLVADLLTISRLDDDNSPTADEPVDMVAVLRETVNDLLPIAEKRDLEFQANLPECAVWVVADRETLRQTAGNLVDNAIKYTPERGVVNVTLKLPTEDSLRLEVADTGIGLSEADQERIFERFYRVDRARSRELGGTGLGLSIVKNTVRNLGGDVGVKSAPGVGSLFWVTLPRLQLSDEAPPAASGPRA